MNQRIYGIKLEIVESEDRSDLLPDMGSMKDSIGIQGYYITRPQSVTKHTVAFSTDLYGLTALKKVLDQLNDDFKKQQEKKS